MTAKQILKGLRHRLESLEKSYEVLNKEDEMDYLLNNYEARIDEIESLIHWIEGKEGN